MCGRHQPPEDGSNATYVIIKYLRKNNMEIQKYMQTIQFFSFEIKFYLKKNKQLQINQKSNLIKKKHLKVDLKQKIQSKI